MVILGYLLTQNWMFSRARIRLIKMAESDDTIADAENQLVELLDAARLDADVLVVPPGDFKSTLMETSGDADLVMLGFVSPDDAFAERFHALYSNFVEDMPTTMIVCSAGHADLTS